MDSAAQEAIAAVPPELMEFREQGKRDLFFFAKSILGFKKLVGRVHGPICRMLENPELRRMNLTMPRGSYKSTLVTTAYPVWRAINDPCVTILIAMNTIDNARNKLREIRTLFQSNDMLRALYPEVIPDFSNARWNDSAACLKRPRDRGGIATFEVSSISGAVISRHYDEIIMDDLVTPKKDDMTGDEILPSVQDIEQAIGWYRMSYSLLCSMKKGRIINVGTRAAQKDLIAFLLGRNDEFAKNNYMLRALDAHGQPTMPEIYDSDDLAELRANQGSTIFSLMYLNEPTSPSEIIFALDPEKHFYAPLSMPDSWVKGLRCYTAVDLAFSSAESADNTAILTLGVDENATRYVLDLKYGKLDPMEVIEYLFAIYARYHSRCIGIESVAAQAMLPRILPHFMRERDTALPIKEIQRGGDKSKTNRITLGVQPWVEQGLVKLPAGGAKPLEIEMRDFRLDEKRRGHDDALDALADAITLSIQARSEAPEEKRKTYSTEEVNRWVAENLFSPEKAIAEILGQSETKKPRAFPQTLRGKSFAYMGN